MISVLKVVKIASLLIGGAIVGTAATLVAKQSETNKYKRETKRAQDIAEEALKTAEQREKSK